METMITVGLILIGVWLIYQAVKALANFVAEILEGGLRREERRQLLKEISRERDGKR